LSRITTTLALAAGAPAFLAAAFTLTPAGGKTVLQPGETLELMDVVSAQLGFADHPRLLKATTWTTPGQQDSRPWERPAPASTSSSSSSAASSSSSPSSSRYSGFSFPGPELSTFPGLDY